MPLPVLRAPWERPIDILPALERARIPTRSGLARTLSAGSRFIDRPYRAASPQDSHRACPALGLATEKLYTENLRLASPFSTIEAYGAFGKLFLFF